jgi:hypothetical protein
MALDIKVYPSPLVVEEPISKVDSKPQDDLGDTQVSPKSSNA